MEEQKEHSTSTSSTSKEGRGGGGRGDGVVKEGADDKKQLSPATIVEDDHDRKQMEVGRLINNEDLVLSNVRDKFKSDSESPFLNKQECIHFSVLVSFADKRQIEASPEFLRL